MTLMFSENNYIFVGWQRRLTLFPSTTKGGVSDHFKKTSSRDRLMTLMIAHTHFHLTGAFADALTTWQFKRLSTNHPCNSFLRGPLVSSNRAHSVQPTDSQSLLPNQQSDPCVYWWYTSLTSSIRNAAKTHTQLDLLRHGVQPRFLWLYSKQVNYYIRLPQDWSRWQWYHCFGDNAEIDTLLSIFIDILQFNATITVIERPRLVTQKANFK